MLAREHKVAQLNHKVVVARAAVGFRVVNQVVRLSAGILFQGGPLQVHHIRAGRGAQPKNASAAEAKDWNNF